MEVIDYRESIALVTGAASGIGAALAGALAGRGAQVICADIDAAGAQRTADAIGGNAFVLLCDLADQTAAAGLIDAAFGIAGRLDLVCSNAGIGLSRSLADEPFDDATINRLFEVNFFAGLKLAQAYSRRLAHSGARGRLLVTASENSLSVPSAVRQARLALYGASKHALLVAMEWLRIEQEDGPLDLHVLLPGAVYTPLVSASLPDPSQAPAELEMIMPEQCADIALRGLDLDLFYIPTQAHLLDDMQPRLRAVEQSLQALGIEKTFGKQD